MPCLFAPQSSLAETAPEGTATIVPWDAGTERRSGAYAARATRQLAHATCATLADAASGLTWRAAADSMVEIYGEAAQAPVRDAATLSRDAVERERRLTAAHQDVVQMLIGEREHAQRMYDELNAEVGSGPSLIGPHGSLPEDLQRALLALSAHPSLSRPLYGARRQAVRGPRALFASRRRCAGYRAALAERAHAPARSAAIAIPSMMTRCPPSRQPLNGRPALAAAGCRTSASRSPRSAATRSRSARCTRSAARATSSCTRSRTSPSRSSRASSSASSDATAAARARC